MEQTSTRQSLGFVALLQSLFADLKLLATQQLRLAVDEMHLELSRLVRIGLSIVALIVAGLALVVILALTVVAALHEVAGLPVWVSSLVVAAALGIGAAGVGFYLKGQITRFRPYPIRTFFTLKEDTQWIKEQIASRKT